MNPVSWRHQLHRLAEPSQHEEKTHAFILQQLQQLSPTSIHTFDDNHNIVAEYFFSDNGPTILLRADFDALPVAETLPLAYASENPTVAHKCGHDGHTAILLDVAARLARAKRDHALSGRVLLFFQEAEEIGAGAAKLLNSHFLQQFKIDKVFALHNIPGYPCGSIICKQGSFTCSVISCEIKMEGITAHAAEPHTGVSPFGALTRVAEAALRWSQPDFEQDDYQVVTLIGLQIGGADYGVAAGGGVLRLTLRAKNDHLLKRRMAEIEALLHNETQREPRLRSEVRWIEYFAESKNNAEAVEQIKRAATANGLPYMEKPQPLAWGEDFGLLTQHYPGAMFGLGAGEHCPNLHHHDYDFPDEILEPGINMFWELVKGNYTEKS